MHTRCYNTRGWSWKDYGGRGIRVCERWHKFENFRDDVGPHPGSGWSIDRPKNDENYGPDNWRWATVKMQARNRRSTKLTQTQANEIRERRLAGEKLASLAIKFGVNVPMISMVARGLSRA